MPSKPAQPSPEKPIGPKLKHLDSPDLVSMGWRGNGDQAARQSKPQDGMSILYGHPKT